ncbi:major facilitator superfamily domain-containing protein [Flagelloscypha sp. PMI_526]|nr:major facilitator superfamily domain-containing protein [Flagelloscypha sp. PMI_526]
MSEAQTVNTKRVWYRTTWFNAHVIGIVGFTAPGLWNAMNSLGAGGAQEPYLVNAANALVFGLMGIFCLLGATVSNYIGLSWTLVLGAVGYPLYSAGLYTNVKFGVVWFVLLGAVIDGISAGLFWASEGAVAVGYPEPAKRGRYLNYWVWWRTLGPLIGGAIVLGLNKGTNKKGHVSTDTYLVFIALQCLSVPVALLLSPPEKVQRSDGTKVQPAPKVSFGQTIRDLGKAFRRREVLLLLPIFAAAYFNSYSSTFATVYFSVRARALNGFLGNIPILLGSQLISHLLDTPRLPQRRRILIGFWIVVFVHVVTWAFAVAVISQFRKTNPVLDWKSEGYVKGFFVEVLWSFSKQILQSWLYYIMGTLTSDITELTRYTGILRGIESFAQAVAYGLNASASVDPWVSIGIQLALFVIAVYPTWLVVVGLYPNELLEDPDQKRDSAASLDAKSSTEKHLQPQDLIKVATREKAGSS